MALTGESVGLLAFIMGILALTLFIFWNNEAEKDEIREAKANFERFEKTSKIPGVSMAGTYPAQKATKPVPVVEPVPVKENKSRQHKFCTQCGKNITNMDKFCGSCGFNLISLEINNSESNEIKKESVTVQNIIDSITMKEKKQESDTVIQSENVIIYENEEDLSKTIRVGKAMAKGTGKVAVEGAKIAAPIAKSAGKTMAKGTVEGAKIAAPIAKSAGKAVISGGMGLFGRKKKKSKKKRK